jgi:hypothetical protein
MQVDAFLRRIARLKADVCELVEMAESLGSTPDPLRDLKYLEALGYKRDYLLARERAGELQIIRGPRDKIQVRQSELDRFEAALPTKPRVSRATAEEPNEWADSEAAELRKLERMTRRTG